MSAGRVHRDPVALAVDADDVLPGIERCRLDGLPVLWVQDDLVRLEPECLDHGAGRVAVRAAAVDQEPGTVMTASAEVVMRVEGQRPDKDPVYASGL